MFALAGTLVVTSTRLIPADRHVTMIPRPVPRGRCRTEKRHDGCAGCSGNVKGSGVSRDKELGGPCDCHQIREFGWGGTARDAARRVANRLGNLLLARPPQDDGSPAVGGVNEQGHRRKRVSRPPFVWPRRTRVNP